ncbi:MAG: dihydrolipoamide acetyltransferase family protein [Thermomicrobiales bacterium]
MPRLGWTMEVGTVVAWLKDDGAEIEAGDLIFSVESDKAVTEVEALDSGVLRIPADSPIGVEVPVGSRLAFILAPGEAEPAAVAAVGGVAPVARSPTIGVQTDGRPHANGDGGEPAISPRARRIAGELGVDWRALAGSGGNGRIRERDVRAAAVAIPSVESRRAAPAVRRLAEANGVEVARLTTGHPAGRITRADVLAASVRPVDPSARVGATPLSAIRRTIVQRMEESARTTASVTLTTEADATELVKLRGIMKDEIGETGELLPSYNDLIVRLTALALRRHPDLNASLTAGGIVRHPGIHIGLAVDTDRGLLAPVVRDADRKSVHAIAAEASALIGATRAGTAPADALRGGTFTVTNLGMYGIDAFTPIINLPECAILGIGRIVAKPVVVDEEAETVAVRRMVALSLTFDHRVVDGAPAARFLQSVVRLIERPYTALTR